MGADKRQQRQTLVEGDHGRAKRWHARPALPTATRISPAAGFWLSRLGPRRHVRSWQRSRRRTIQTSARQRAISRLARRRDPLLAWVRTRPIEQGPAEIAATKPEGGIGAARLETHAVESRQLGPGRVQAGFHHDNVNSEMFSDRRLNDIVCRRVSDCLQIPTFRLLRVAGCML